MFLSIFCADFPVRVPVHVDFAYLYGHGCRYRTSFVTIRPLSDVVVDGDGDVNAGKFVAVAVDDHVNVND